MLNFLILILSIAIYLSFGISNIIYILFSALTSFYGAKYLKNKKSKLILSLVIIANLSILLFFKVFNTKNILVPLGISYYTFQIISYIVDVYKGKTNPEESLWKYLLYVFYIPYIFIGPITRYNDVKDSLYAKKKFNKDNFYFGLLRIFWGLFKKYVIAGRIALVIAVITKDPSVYNGAYALLAMILYYIELYSDFSGGIDMVIGVSKIFGIELKENFNVPYIAETIQDFWRRWHIALSSWFRDYVYIPLGGNRVSKLRHKFNLMVTFLLSGFWHGTTYILWGLFHGILIVFNNLFKTKWKWLNITITFLLVSFLWSFFIWTDSYILPLQMMGSVFTHLNFIDLCHNILNLGLDLPNIIVLVISIIMLVIYDLNKDKIVNKIKTSSLELKVSIICLFILIILLFGIYGIGFNAQDFIYSKF